jgi:multisubunit Na+/H+ antiporter MnhE subunit
MKNEAPQICDRNYVAFLIGSITVIVAMCLWVFLKENYTPFEGWLVGLSSAFIIITLVNSYKDTKEKIKL